MLDRESWNELLKDTYQGVVNFSVPMSLHTYLAIGGPADALTEPSDPLSLHNLLVQLERKNIPFFPLGGGSNILVRDHGIDGVVISVKSFKRIDILKEENDHAELFVEAGVPLQRLVNFCRGKGYSGVEGLTGIPGTVGGAICGNAGSFGHEMKDVLVSVAIMDSSGRLERFKAEGLAFGYRKSDIQSGDVVISAMMKLKRDEKEQVASRMKRFLTEKKARQPITEKSAGCVFRNPEGVPAGRLIEDAGCKGMRIGGIEVSKVHANFFINRSGGTASDYINLMHEVASIVNRKFGITLEPEIRMVGRA